MIKPVAVPSSCSYVTRRYTVLYTPRHAGWMQSPEPAQAITQNYSETTVYGNTLGSAIKESKLAPQSALFLKHSWQQAESDRFKQDTHCTQETLYFMGTHTLWYNYRKKKTINVRVLYTFGTVRKTSEKNNVYNSGQFEQATACMPSKDVENNATY